MILEGWGCSSSDRVVDQHAADAGSIPQLWLGIFLPESTFSEDFYCVCTTLCTSACINICARGNEYVLHVKSSVDYGNTKTSIIHGRLANAAVAAGFSRGKKSKFLWESPSGTTQMLKKASSFNVGFVLETL